MTKIEQLEKRIAELEAEVTKLKAQKPEWHYHYHYSQPPYQQPYYVYPPNYIPSVTYTGGLGAGLSGSAGGGTYTISTNAITYGPQN